MKLWTQVFGMKQAHERHHNSREARLVRVIVSAGLPELSTGMVQERFNELWPKWSLSIVEVASTLSTMPDVVRTNQKGDYPATWSMKEA